MAGKTPQQAVDNFLAPVRRSVSCIATNEIYATGYQPSPKPHALTVNGAKPIDVVSTAGVEFQVSISQNYRIVEVVDSADLRGPWKVNTTKYVYSFHDDGGQIIFEYHWHPDIGPKYPHAHVKASNRADLRKAHFPTGRISLEEFLYTLIVEFRIKPRRSGWRKILADSQAAFARGRTW